MSLYQHLLEPLFNFLGYLHVVRLVIILVSG